VWTIPSYFSNPHNYFDGDTWVWDQTVGITCKDVFVSVLYTTSRTKEYSDETIARIPLDSLGPGEPAP